MSSEPEIDPFEVNPHIKLRLQGIERAKAIRKRRKIDSLPEMIDILLAEEESRERANFKKHGSYHIYDGVGRIADW